jgi:hypothetical protein
MPDTTRPSIEDYDLLTTVNAPDTSYIDSTVSIHTPYDNYYIWYAATAVDDSSHESLMAETVSFWGYYEGDSNGKVIGLIDAALPHQTNITVSPNPFNPRTTINFALPEASQVRLTVYDVQGHQVAQLVNGWRDAGSHSVAFDGTNLPSGIYVYRLTAGGFDATGKMVLMK